MKRQRIFLIMIILGVVAGYSFVAIRTETGPTMGIEIDLSKPASIIWPCEIDYMSDNGEKGLRIPPNVGRGWLEEAGGSATYKFFIQEDDEYSIWIYCKWYDECTNAVYVRVDDQGKAIVGNDPIYRQWHWVRGFPIHLDQGTHTFLIANHSDNIELLKVRLINSSSSGPEDSEITFSDLFYDGFDGCDEGNFSSWQVVNGLWQAMDPLSQSCLQQNALKGVSEEDAMIVLTDESWQNYSFDMEIKTELFDSKESELGVCFGVQGSDNYYMLSFVPKERDSFTVTAAVSRQTFGQSVPIQSFEMPWPQKGWRRLQIRGDSDSIDFVLDDEEMKTVPLYNQIPVQGGIGYALKGKTVAYFDNIHVRKIEEEINQEKLKQ